MNKKFPKITQIVLILIFTLFSFNTANGFSDILTTHHEYIQPINYLSDNNVVNGYKDNTFKPEWKITRAAFIKVLVNSIYEEEEIDSCIKNSLKPYWTYTFFPDVDRNAWYSKYVCTAFNHGLVKGYAGGHFYPHQYIRATEALKLLIEGFGFEIVPEKNWYQPYITFIQSNNIVPPTLDTFMKELTRGEMAYLIFHLLELSKEDKISNKIINSSHNNLISLTEEDRDDVYEKAIISPDQLSSIKDVQKNGKYTIDQDCVALDSHLLGQGDLLSTIMYQGENNLSLTLEKYKSVDYLYEIYKATKNIFPIEANKKFYAYKLCNLRENYDVLIGATLEYLPIIEDSNIVYDIHPGLEHFAIIMDDGIATSVSLRDINHTDHIKFSRSPYKIFEDQNGLFLESISSVLYNDNKHTGYLSDKHYILNQDLGLESDAQYISDTFGSQEKTYIDNENLYSFKYPSELGDFKDINLFESLFTTTKYFNSGQYHVSEINKYSNLINNCNNLGYEKLNNGCLAIGFDHLNKDFLHHYCFETPVNRIGCFKLGDRDFSTDYNLLMSEYEEQVNSNVFKKNYITGFIDENVPEAIMLAKKIDKTLSFMYGAIDYINSKLVNYYDFQFIFPTEYQVTNRSENKLNIGMNLDVEIISNLELKNAYYTLIRKLSSHEDYDYYKEKNNELKKDFNLEVFLNILEPHNLVRIVELENNNKLFYINDPIYSNHAYLQVDGYNKKFIKLKFVNHQKVKELWFHNFLNTAKLIIKNRISDLTLNINGDYQTIVTRVHAELENKEVCNNIGACINIRYPYLNAQKLETMSFHRLKKEFKKHYKKHNYQLVTDGSYNSRKILVYKIKQGNSTSYKYYAYTLSNIIELSFDHNMSNIQTVSQVNKYINLVKEVISSIDE